MEKRGRAANRYACRHLEGKCVKWGCGIVLTSKLCGAVFSRPLQRLVMLFNLRSVSHAAVGCVNGDGGYIAMLGTNHQPNGHTHLTRTTPSSAQIFSSLVKK